MFAVMMDREYATKKIFIDNFMNDWRMVLGKNHVIKKFELCDFTAIYEWHMKEKEKKKQMSTEVSFRRLLGSMLIFLFSAWACSAVGRTAQEVVNEVRRQFIDRPGIMVSIYICSWHNGAHHVLNQNFMNESQEAFYFQEYKEKPDYGRCVAIVASASLREMIKPGALAIISPMVTGELHFFCIT